MLSSSCWLAEHQFRWLVSFGSAFLSDQIAFFVSGVELTRQTKVDYLKVELGVKE